MTATKQMIEAFKEAYNDVPISKPEDLAGYRIEKGLEAALAEMWLPIDDYAKSGVHIIVMLTSGAVLRVYYLPETDEYAGCFCDFQDEDDTWFEKHIVGYMPITPLKEKE